MLSPGALLLTGFLTGLMLGLTLRHRPLSCFSLTLIPAAAYGYVGWWQSHHPELLRSTSGLEFLFVPVPPMIGALAGYGLVAFINEWRA